MLQSFPLFVRCESDGEVSEVEGSCKPSDSNTCDTSSEETDKNPIRVITLEELKAHQDTPEHESEVLWLSILGEVYDVTPGRQYYGKGASYSIMAGRDASPSFVTGEFTEEGAAKSLSEIDPKEIAAINEWKKFYVESDKYFKVGVLEGLYYDSEGKETPALIEAMGKVEEGERLAKIERERRAQIRKDKLAKRKKEREAKEKLKQKKK